MQIETADQYQRKFKNGLFIVGQNEDGDLEWMGTKDEMNQVRQQEDNENWYYDMMQKIWK